MLGPTSLIMRYLDPLGHSRIRKLEHGRRSPNVALLRASCSLLNGIWDILKGSWGAL